MDYCATPVLIIGSGISGLFTALKVADAGVQVMLVTKSKTTENNSRYAQGGIAAVLPENEDDSLELHVQDTLIAGAGLCDENAVRSILGDGHLAIADLLLYGVPFDRSLTGGLELTREAAHSVRRIIHAGGDATGKSVEMTLIQKVEDHPLIETLEYCSVQDLVIRDGRCVGVRVVSIKDHRQWGILADHVVLATGGVGRLYEQTTNPTIATGDGMALAHRAGATLQGMEFVQFHPTAFHQGGRVHFLISEALRGEGGILRTATGEPFAKKYHPDGELAPRDIVTRGIFTELQASGEPCVYLDVSHLPTATIEHRFPTILQACQSFGVDIRTEPIPVAPAAHYMMGGIHADTHGITSVPGLYAVGEVAHTGLHGANRLASNSLLECVVLARRVAETIVQGSPLAKQGKQGKQGKAPASLKKTKAPEKRLNLTPLPYWFTVDRPLVDRVHQFHQLMWDKVGIIRTDTGLREAQEALTLLQEEAQEKNWFRQVPEGVEYRNQLQVGQLIVQAALDRVESLGAHYRLSDTVPTTEPNAPEASIPLV